MEEQVEETEGAGLHYGQKAKGVWGPGEREGPEHGEDEPEKGVGSP